jgi:hypothetical protein
MQWDVREWKRRRTPLMVAASKGHVEVVRALVGLGASVNEGKSDGRAAAMLAAWDAAASTAPWGEIAVPATKEAMEGGEEDGAEDIPISTEVRERQHLVALSNSAVCPLTTAFVQAATSGWSSTRHWLHHANLRGGAVHTLALVSERLQRAAAARVAEGRSGLASQFVRFVDAVFRCNL